MASAAAGAGVREACLSFFMDVYACVWRVGPPCHRWLRHAGRSSRDDAFAALSCAYLLPFLAVDAPSASAAACGAARSGRHAKRWGYFDTFDSCYPSQRMPWFNIRFAVGCAATVWQYHVRAGAAPKASLPDRISSSSRVGVCARMHFFSCVLAVLLLLLFVVCRVRHRVRG